jgi:hypothetical protein
MDAMRGVFRGTAALSGAVLFAGAVPAAAQPLDASMAAGRPLAPVGVRWAPVLTGSPLPEWVPGPVEMTPVSATFPVPARWSQPAIDRYVLTVVFYDTEDTGPVVEWRSSAGVLTRLSEGLGEGQESLGLHARIMVLPDVITREGGSLIVSMPWRQNGLVSATVQPARDVTVAVTGASLQPGLVGRGGNVVESELLEGREVPPASGDIREGPIVEAGLTSAIEHLDGELEFAVPVEGVVEGAILHTEVMGLDPAARIDIEINGRRIGEMNPEAFRLDDASVTIEANGALGVAGWRRHWLFMPGGEWRQGDNALVLRLRNASGATAVSIKNALLHLRFGDDTGLAGAEPAGLFPPGLDAPSEVPADPWPTVADESTEPDFETPLPLVSDPPVLPVVVTAPPPQPFSFPPLTFQQTASPGH